jgi:NAD(P)-dependent dehydrogenase (short-subunit alcohol dehydrogenase family)
MISGQVVLVTGGCRGIGAAISRRLVAEQLRVVATYKTSRVQAERLERCAPSSLRAVPADFAAEGFDPEQFIDDAIGVFGVLDHLVCCAAVVDDRKLDQLTLASVTEVFTVNVAAPALLVAAICRRIEQGMRPLNSIVCVSSVAERYRGPDSLSYEASKAALSQLTRGLAHDLAPQGTRANAVAPGAIHTERKAVDPAWDRQAVGQLVPLGRTGEPADIADVVAFLLSEDASYLTGQVIYVDGGLSTRL